MPTRCDNASPPQAEAGRRTIIRPTNDSSREGGATDIIFLVERLESLARDVLDTGPAAGEDGPGDLFTLAQTVALLTRGIVVIEDTASRVLAYSRSDSDAAQVDELRRLSILGWQGPADYLRLLREWQSERLAHTHADLLADRRFGPACRFFLSDVYAARDFSQRDHDIERMYNSMRLVLPAAMQRALELR